MAEAALGRIVLWNDAAAQMFGYTPEEAFGLLVEDLVHPSFKRQHRAVSLAQPGDFDSCFHSPEG